MYQRFKGLGGHKVGLESADSLTFVFQPGGLGLGFGERSGRIGNVTRGTQASNAGVQVGWVMIRVDDCEYSAEVLDSRISGKSSYHITFAAIAEFNAPEENASRSLLPLQMESSDTLAAPMSRSIEQEDKHLISIEDRYELRVRVLGVTGLKAPAYRLFDFTHRLICGSDALFSSVYGKVSLGSSSVIFYKSNKVKDGKTDLSDDTMCMLYRGEAKSLVRLLDNKGIRNLVRGVPLIGDGSLPLPGKLQECQLRSITLPVERDGKTTGEVRLQYEIVKVVSGSTESTSEEIQQSFR
jgi:hypothetical protein